MTAQGSSLTSAQLRAVRELVQVDPVIAGVGELFAAAGFEIALVGGPVRDLLLGRLGNDLDFTTNALPAQTKSLLSHWADAVYDMGQAFGTIGGRKAGRTLEITTYRAEAYDRRTRKPEVKFGESLAEDLLRRDFTVNAMAIRLPDLSFVDLHGGLDDLASKVLRTPATPEQSFADDPLRMMRAARFSAQLGFALDPYVLSAMQDMADRLDIVSAERIRDEFTKTLMSPDPRRGLALLVVTGLAVRFLPELTALRMEIDEHHRHKDVYEHSLTVLDQAIALEHRLPVGGPDLVTRLAALLHDIGKPRTRRHEAGGGVSFHHHEIVGARMVTKRLSAMRYPGDVVAAVASLTDLHLRFHGYGEGEWTDSAVRRYVRDAGPLLERLHIVTRADCTTRNKRRAQRLASAYDDLEARIARLAEEEELAAIRPDLDGNQVIELLGIRPGPVVGQAMKFLLELRLDSGPQSHDAAQAALLAWWAKHPANPATEGD